MRASRGYLCRVFCSGKCAVPGAIDHLDYRHIKHVRRRRTAPRQAGRQVTTASQHESRHDFSKAHVCQRLYACAQVLARGRGARAFGRRSCPNSVSSSRFAFFAGGESRLEPRRPRVPRGETCSHAGRPGSGAGGVRLDKHRNQRGIYKSIPYVPCAYVQEGQSLHFGPSLPRRLLQNGYLLL